MVQYTVRSDSAARIVMLRPKQMLTIPDGVAVACAADRGRGPGYSVALAHSDETM